MVINIFFTSEHPSRLEISGLSSFLIRSLALSDIQSGKFITDLIILL